MEGVGAARVAQRVRAWASNVCYFFCLSAACLLYNGFGGITSAARRPVSPDWGDRYAAWEAPAPPDLYVGANHMVGAAIIP